MGGGLTSVSLANKGRRLISKGVAIGEKGQRLDATAGDRILADRSPRPDLRADPDLPDDTRLWAALQAVSGGTWGGCVFDVERITELLGTMSAGR